MASNNTSLFGTATPTWTLAFVAVIPSGNDNLHISTLSTVIVDIQLEEKIMDLRYIHFCLLISIIFATTLSNIGMINTGKAIKIING